MQIHRTVEKKENMGFRFDLNWYYLFLRITEDQKNRYKAKVVLATDTQAKYGKHECYFSIYSSRYGWHYWSKETRGGKIEIAINITPEWYSITIKIDNKIEKFISDLIQSYEEIDNDEDLFT